MPTKTTPPKSNKKLTDREKFTTCASMLLFVIKGLRNRSITSKPIMTMEASAQEYPMTTLEDECWKALNLCGVTEKVPVASGQRKKHGKGK